MITEDYCDFETAKLLKEKGFNERCTHYYKNEKYLVDLGYTNIHSYTNSDLVEEFAAPTLQMAIKWLREVHNLYIEITTNSKTNEFIVDSYRIDIVTKNFDTVYVSSGYDTYEEACETAIKYCLENLI